MHPWTFLKPTLEFESAQNQVGVYKFFLKTYTRCSGVYDEEHKKLISILVGCFENCTRYYG